MRNPGARILAVMATAAALSAGSLAAPVPARAHVHAVSPGAVRGSIAIVMFQVPNESPNGSATTELTVVLPDVASARTETKPGWTARLDRDAAAGTVRSVTWTAGPNAGIGADEFGLFRISMKLPDTDTVQFPAVQKYADGTAVHWDQPPRPDGGEPEHPAATLSLAAGPVAPPEHHASPTHPPSVTTGPAEDVTAGGTNAATDNPARVLAGVALLTAALGVTIAIARRRA